MGCFHKFKIALFAALLIGTMQMCVNGMEEQKKQDNSQQNRQQPSAVQLLSGLCVTYGGSVIYLRAKILVMLDEDLELSEIMGNDLIMLIRNLSCYKKFCLQEITTEIVKSKVRNDVKSISSDAVLFLFLCIFVRNLRKYCGSVNSQDFIVDNNVLFIGMTSDGPSYTKNAAEKDAYIVAVGCMKVQEKMISKWESILGNTNKESLLLASDLMILDVVLLNNEYPRGAELLRRIIDGEDIKKFI